jgi:hypothetical protein
MKYKKVMKNPNARAYKRYYVIVNDKGYESKRHYNPKWAQKICNRINRMLND